LNICIFYSHNQLLAISQMKKMINRLEVLFHWRQMIILRNIGILIVWVEY